MNLTKTFERVKDASRSLTQLSDARINEILNAVADAAVAGTDRILAENAKDLAQMPEDNPMYDRLKLTPERIAGIASDMRHVAQLPSPLGRILKHTVLPNGLDISRVSVPFGVIGIIYEARPNVSFDVFSLCFKAGSACVLKGGTDAHHSNSAIVALIHEVLAGFGVDTGVVELLPAGRESTGELLNARGYVDLIIPRGSAGLINYVRQHAAIPVIETGAGVCHAYFDKAADLVKGSFDAVTGALSNMGLAGDEVTQQLLGDIGEMIGSAGQLATGIATGNPLGIIQGSIGLISSAFEVFNFRDRRAERAIKKHAAAVEELERVYKALEHAVDKALGESVYDNQKALINNMREQQAHLRAMWQEEEGKKKTDSGKVNQYKEQYEELGRQIEDTIAEITESVTQTSAKDLATQLSDAIAEAYADGFNSDNVKNAIEKVTNQVLGNAVKNALKKQFLEQQLQNAVKQLQRDMGFDEEGGGSFDGLTPEEQQRFKDRVNSIAQGYAEALKLYEDLFKDLDDTGDPTTSLSGAIKGASQESINLLAGQTNAVRVNQVQQIEVLRQQLIHLANIDGKLSVSNRHLEQIEKNTSGSASDPLRAQGITM